MFMQESVICPVTQARAARLKVLFGKWFTQSSGFYCIYDFLVYFVFHVFFLSRHNALAQRFLKRRAFGRFRNPLERIVMRVFHYPTSFRNY